MFVMSSVVAEKLFGPDHWKLYGAMPPPREMLMAPLLAALHKGRVVFAVIVMSLTFTVHCKVCEHPPSCTVTEYCWVELGWAMGLAMLVALRPLAGGSGAW